MNAKVEGYPGLVRDDSSKAIVSEDRTAYQAYVNEVKFRQNVGGIREEVDSLKSDISEIKSMLAALLQGKQQQ